MKPYYIFEDSDRNLIFDALQSIKENPFHEYEKFSLTIDELSNDNSLDLLREICTTIRLERESGKAKIHLLRNCPVDKIIPDLNSKNPIFDKHEKKKTFIGEGFLALFAKLTGTPLLSYATRNNGDFFTDVVAIEKYSGMQTGFSDSELFYHNDRTAHRVRADFISLLGLRCPSDNLIYTGFIDGRDLLTHLSIENQFILRQPYFITPFDVFSKEANSRLDLSENHPILEHQHSFRYLDAVTCVAIDSPVQAKDALISIKNAVVKVNKIRHKIINGDLLAFANQDGLHNREKIEVNDPQSVYMRWLLKTYSFRDEKTADYYANEWVNKIHGCVGD